MSKAKIRIVLAVIVAVGLIAAVYTTVLGASAGVVRGGAHLTAGLLPDVTHQRAALKSLDSYFPAGGEGDGHECEREGVNPNDY